MASETLSIMRKIFTTDIAKNQAGTMPALAPMLLRCLSADLEISNTIYTFVANF